MDYGLGESIYTALSGSSDVTAIFGSRIYEDEAPENTALPLLVWGVRNLKQLGLQRISAVEGSVVVDLYLDAKGSTVHWSALATPVKAALHDQRFSRTSENAVATVRFGDGQVIASGAGRHVSQIYDVKLRYQEANSS